MLERLPLNALRAFVLAAREESFKRAAETLHVTPGAVSRHVKRLERHLGAPLFERHARGVRLTARGRRLAAAADDGFERLATAVATARVDRRRAPSLTISAPPSLFQHWLLSRLGAFEAAHRDLDIVLDASATLVAPAWDETGARLAIRYTSDPGTAHRRRRLLDETFFPVCAPELLGRGRPLREPADLAHHDLLDVAWRSEQADRFAGWRGWLDFAGGRNVPIGTLRRYSLYGLALDQAIAGHGVALASSVLAADRLASGVLVRPFGERYRMPSPFAYELLMPDTGQPPPAASAFIDWLCAQADAFRRAQRSAG